MGYTIVEVRWDDAAISTEDFDRDTAQKTRPPDRWTVGYYIEETDKALILATDYFVLDDGKEEFSGKLTIPWGMVTEYHHVITK